MEKAKFDRQLADLVWSMVTALKAGYSIPQIFGILSEQAPEPAASSCGRVQADLQRGISISEAVGNWQQTTASEYLGEVVAIIQKQQQTGGNLAFMLEPLSDEIFAKTGSDGAFYPMMRELAQNVGASMPSRVQDK